MVQKNSAYWRARRVKTGGKFLRNAGSALAAPSVASVAAAAWSGVKAIRALINVETFVLDTQITQVTVTGTPYITQLNGVAIGDAQNQRTGNSILMANVRRTEYVVTAAPNAIVREILFYDKQQIADTAPASTDLLESNSVLSLYNKLSASRFQVLEDKLYTLNSVSKTSRIIRNFKKLQKHASFNGALSSDIQKMGLYKLIITDGVVTYAANYRLTYHDN